MYIKLHDDISNRGFFREATKHISVVSLSLYDEANYNLKNKAALGTENSLVSKHFTIKQYKIHE